MQQLRRVHRQDLKNSWLKITSASAPVYQKCTLLHGPAPDSATKR